MRNFVASLHPRAGAPARQAPGPSARPWRGLLLALLLLLPAFAALAQPAVPSTTSFTGLAHNTSYANASSPATAANVGGTGWTFTGILAAGAAGNVSIIAQASTGTSAGAQGTNDPYIRTGRISTADDLTEVRVKPSSPLTFRLTSVYLNYAVATQTQTLTLTGYLAGSPVTGATLAQGATANYQWVQFNTSAIAAFNSIDEFRVTVTNTGGALRGNIGVDEISIAAPLPAPAFTTQPSGTSVCQGATATLTAAASGSPSYQYYSNGTTNSNTGGTAISGATSASYNAPTTTGGTTYYYVVATNASGSTASNAVAVTVTATAAPTGNANQSFSSGATVANLVATGTGIQWYAASSGGSPLATSTALVNGTTYYATQTVGGCESQSRLAVTATVTAAATPAPCAPAYTTGGTSRNVPLYNVFQQSFTATCTGRLTTMVFTFSSNADDLRGQGYPVRVSLLDAAGTTVLATLPPTDQISPNSTRTYDFSAANAVLTSGTQYRWELRQTQGNTNVTDPNTPLYLLDTYAGNPYAGGQAYSLVPAPANGSSTPPTADRDFRGWTVNIAPAIVTGTVAGPLCAGSAVSVPFSFSGTVVVGAGNVYTAQLSSASGSFASPVSIGTLSSTASSGTVSATVPAGTAAGTGYRIRVIASNPATPGADNGTDLTITNTSAPTGSASQGFSSGATVANLVATGTGIQWYAASSGGSPLASSTALVNGTTYYATQTVSGCESGSRLAVTATVAAPATAPTVTTATPPTATVQTTSVQFGGEVTATGGATVTGRGVVYSTSATTPTLSSANTTTAPNGAGLGIFQTTISGLSPGTRYYVVAYATNSAGTSYGAVVQVTTTPNAPVVSAPANGSYATTATPTYTGTAQAGSTVTVLVDGSSIGTTTATGGGTFSLVQPSALAQGNHYVQATATVGASAASAGSNINPFTVDSVPPTVTLASSAGSSGGSTSTSPIPFTANFSENVTGFAVADISVTGGTVTGGSLSGGGSGPYSFTVTPSGAGTVAVSVPAGGAQDVAGNGNAASTTYTLTYSLPATAAPVLSTPANNALLATATPTYSGTAPAGSTVTVVVDGSSIGTTTATGGTWTLTQPTALAQGSHTVRATAQASGAAVSGNSNTNTFTVDTVAPTTSIGSTAGASGGGTATSPVPFTVTFSESVTGFVAGDVTVSNGTVSGFSGSGSSYGFNVTPTTPGTATTVSVAANVAQDAAGNGNAAAPAYSLTYTPAAQPYVVSGGTLTSPTSIPAGTYTTVTVPTGTVGQLGGAVVVTTGLTVNNGGTLLTACQSLTGAGSFTLAAGGTLYVCDAAGISSSGATGAVRVSGPRSFAPDASYVYNGTAAQSTGTGLPAQVRNLSTTNASPVTLTSATSVAQVLTLANAGNLALNGQALTLLSDASGTALVVNSGAGLVTGGTATVQRYLTTANQGLGYRHYASPVRGNTLSDLVTPGFAPVFSSAYNSSPTPGNIAPFPNVFGYDQSRLATANSNYGAFDKGYFSPVDAAGTVAAFVPGVGYTVNIAGTQKVDFTGTLNTGPYARTLARNAAGTPGAADAGWHLVGNPYPAPLDYSQVLPADRPGLDGAMYVFASTGPYAGSYRTYLPPVDGQPGIGNPLVGSSQGFFVRVSDPGTAGTLSFRDGQRITDYATQQVVRRGAASTRPVLTLALAGNGLSDALTVYAQAGASAGLDAQFDAAKLPNPSGLNLASLSATGQALAIDGRPAFTAATVVPLQVAVPAAGPYTLTAETLANLAGTRAELVDNLTGTRTVLTTGTAYAFTTATTTAPGRFWLNFAPAAGALASAAQALDAQVLAYPNPTTGRLTVLRPAGAVASAVLLNALGQTVQTLALPTAQTTVDLTGLATGVYTLRLTLAGQPVSKRVVVE